MRYENANNEFKLEFDRFKEMGLSKQNLQSIIQMEDSIQKKYEKLEAEISNNVKVSKEITIDNPGPSNYPGGSLQKMTDTLDPEESFHGDWHKLRFEIDHQLNKIANEMKKPYNWLQHCLCNSCISSKKFKPKEVKRLKEQWKVEPSGKFYPV